MLSKIISLLEWDLKIDPDICTASRTSYVKPLSTPPQTVLPLGLSFGMCHALAQGLQGSSADWLTSGLGYRGSFHSKLNQSELKFE